MFGPIVSGQSLLKKCSACSANTDGVRLPIAHMLRESVHSVGLYGSDAILDSMPPVGDKGVLFVAKHGVLHVSNSGWASCKSGIHTPDGGLLLFQTAKLCCDCPRQYHTRGGDEDKCPRHSFCSVRIYGLAYPHIPVDAAIKDGWKAGSVPLKEGSQTWQFAPVVLCAVGLKEPPMIGSSKSSMNDRARTAAYRKVDYHWAVLHPSAPPGWLAPPPPGTTTTTRQQQEAASLPVASLPQKRRFTTSPASPEPPPSKRAAPASSISPTSFHRSPAPSCLTCYCTSPTSSLSESSVYSPPLSDSPAAAQYYMDTPPPSHSPKEAQCYMNTSPLSHSLTDYTPCPPYPPTYDPSLCLFDAPPSPASLNCTASSQLLSASSDLWSPPASPQLPFITPATPNVQTMSGAVLSSFQALRNDLPSEQQLDREDLGTALDLSHLADLPSQVQRDMEDADVGTGELIDTATWEEWQQLAEVQLTDNNFKAITEVPSVS